MKKIIQKTLEQSSKRELSKYQILGILFCFSFFLSILVLYNSPDYTIATEQKAELIVVIDAGHGGNDPGKVSSDNILEKDVNLSIAFCLKEQLEAEGITVIMTRENDVSLATEGATNKKSSDMKNRVQLINESNAVCFISIHQNSYTDSSVKGGQVFYYEGSEESQALASEIQDNLRIIDPDNHRQIKTGNDYYILRKSVCPGVIVECGFLSCPAETALLVSPEYQTQIAEAITSAICTLYK